MTSNQAPLRVGLIGAGGNMKLRHIPGFQETGEVELVSVCNRSEASGRAIADEYGIPRVEPDRRRPPRRRRHRRRLHRHMALQAPRSDHRRHRGGQARPLRGAHGHERHRGARDARHRRGASPTSSPSSSRPPSTSRAGSTIRRLLEDGSIGDVRDVHVTVLGGASLNLDAPLHWRDRTDLSGMNVMAYGIYTEIIAPLARPHPLRLRPRGDLRSRAHQC